MPKIHQSAIVAMKRLINSFTIITTAFLISFFLSCNDNPTSTNPNTILAESKSVERNFIYLRNSTLNADTVELSLETSIPDVYLITNFSIKRYIGSYGYTQPQIDTTITNFQIQVHADYIKLIWETRFEINNQGWEIQRKDNNQSYIKIGFVNGAGTSNSPHTYSFNDMNGLSDTIFYRFKKIAFDGSYQYMETRLDVSARDSIKAITFVSAVNGVIIYDGDIAPDSGYVNNLQINVGDKIYFRNSYSHYGRLNFKDFILLNNPYLNLGEPSKNFSYKMSYELFLQTHGNRTFD